MPSIPALTRTRTLLALLTAVAGCCTTPAQAQPEDPSESPEAVRGWGEQPDAAGTDRPRTNRAGARGVRAGAVQRGSVQPQAEPGDADDTVSFQAFSEPMELTTLIDFVGETLGLNIVVRGSPAGEIVFNAPVSVPRSQLLDLLDAMLEQYQFTIVYDPATTFYIVQPTTDVRPSLGGARASVRIIPTPNIKPSQLAGPLAQALGGTAASGAAPGGGATPGGVQIQAVDELGVLIVSAPSRDIARVEAMVEELRRVDAMQEYIRIELFHVAAPAALERAIGLVGGAPSSGLSIPQQPIQRGGRNDQLAQAAGITGGSFSNLADRITVDPQGNALIFRGTPDEIDRVVGILDQIDVPNTLEPKNYFAGSSAAQIAEMAQIRGLGQVIQVSDQQDQNEFGQFQFFQNQMRAQAGLQQQDAAPTGGPVMVVDSTRGSIIYYATPQQHTQMANLMKELRAEDERIVIRSYVLNHSDSETVADLITGLITGQRQTGDAPLLPTSRGLNRPGAAATRRQLPVDPNASGDEVSASFDPDVVVVLANPENNQVVVQAPLKQQDEIAKLIERLDRRRAQVYIQAQIVAVTDNEDFTLAFESQYLRGEFGIGTNFGLSRVGEDGSFTDPREVAPSLAGLTAAIIRSDYVPLIINATQTNTDVRIISSPQVLVNDNEEASIVSIEEQPYSTTNFGQTTDTTTFGGYETAGTELFVTPSISDGGFIRLEYEIELSNFLSGVGLGDGLPPPRNTRTVTGKSTIPTDATIVIGGLTVEDVRDTVLKVPFIGDIPLVGHLFRRTNKVNNRARVYVFLTPRIMSDPNFNDLKLLTQGPQASMELDRDAPALEAEPIRSTAPVRGATPELEPARAD